MSQSGRFLSSLESDSVLALASLSLIVLFVYLGISRISPPAVVPADASPAEFSASRAKRQLQVVARQPRPTGSGENAKVRQYIVDELAALGLNPETQEAEVFGQPQGAFFLLKDAQPQTLEKLLPWLSQEALQSDAPASSSPPPKLEALDESPDGEASRLRLRLTSPRQAPMLIITAGPETEVAGAVINGKRVEKGEAGRDAQNGAGWGMIYFAPPEEGIELILELKTSQQPHRFQLQDLSYELPQIPGGPATARPNDMMPAPIWGASDTTILTKSYTVERPPR